VERGAENTEPEIADRAREWLEAGSFFDWVPAEALRHASELRIFHAEFGDPEAPTLLLLHGFPTSSVDWFDVVEALGHEHHVCVLDFPGFGFSDKPQGESYTLARDAELVEYHLREVLAAEAGSIVAHDRGDSVALAFAARCAAGETPFDLTDLVLTNGNMFLPLSSLNEFQRLMLDPDRAAQIVESATPELLAAGLGEHTFTPPRSLDDPAIAALASSFAVNDGLAVVHDTIQYLVERSEDEQGWLEALAASTVPTTLVWGLYDTISPLRVPAYIWNAYLSVKPGRNEFWLLPLANHYLQNDQPGELVEVITAALSRSSPESPGPAHASPGAPILVDRSRERLPSAKEVLSGA
jgi:pimeloyl-ACP methyl ester carboxylesterase